MLDGVDREGSGCWVVYYICWVLGARDKMLRRRDVESPVHGEVLD
jgi:hypothetical protein